MQLSNEQYPMPHAPGLALSGYFVVGWGGGAT